MSLISQLPPAPSGAPKPALRHKSNTKAFVSKAKSVHWPKKHKPNPFKAAFDYVFGKPSLDLTPVGPRHHNPDGRPILHMHNPFAVPTSPILKTSSPLSNGRTVWWQDQIVGVDIASISATGIASMSATGIASMCTTGASSLSITNVSSAPPPGEFLRSGSFSPNDEDLAWLLLLARHGDPTPEQDSGNTGAELPTEHTSRIPTILRPAAGRYPASLSVANHRPRRPRHPMSIKPRTSTMGENLSTSFDHVGDIHSALANAIPCRKSLLSDGMPKSDSLIFLF